jgi:hypothetical protein
MPQILTQIRALDGDLILDLNPSTGFRRVTLTAPGAALWEVPTETGAYVDGETQGPTPPRRPAYTRNEVLRVRGNPALAVDARPYWLSVEDRIEELVAAVATPFLWVVCDGGYVWTYRSIGPGSVDPTMAEKEDLVAGRRPIALRFKVQPNPTKTNPDEEP